MSTFMKDLQSHGTCPVCYRAPCRCELDSAQRGRRGFNMPFPRARSREGAGVFDEQLYIRDQDAEAQAAANGPGTRWSSYPDLEREWLVESAANRLRKTRALIEMLNGPQRT